jgi:hypothetical protein
MKTNKWKQKEKFFKKLKTEYYNTPYGRGVELRNKLYQDFYDWFRMPSAPYWYRRMLNRKRRHSHKNIIYLVKNNSLDWDNATFDDNYRDSGWYW